MNNNHYQTLNIDSNATPNEIKKSYRQLSFKYHPDRNKSPDANIQMEKLNSAYEILGDPDKRKNYDNQLKYGFSDNDDISMDDFSDIHNLFASIFKETMKNPPDMNSFATFSFIPPNMHSNMIPNMFPNMPHPTSTPQDNTPNFSQFPFNKLFQSSNNPFSQNPFHNLTEPETITTDYTISFSDSYNGLNTFLYVDRWVIVNSRKIKENTKINFIIHPGIQDNEVIIVNNVGNFIDKNNIGDVEIIIKINNDTPFTRENNDLIFKKEISFKESLCGVSFVLNHINGKSFNLNNNNDEKCTLIYHGFRRVIPKFGFKNGDHIGNLIIDFSVKYPSSLNSSQIKAIREII